jgi:DNA polymerase II small subunit/DNA polymerase delta subunit B
MAFGLGKLAVLESKLDIYEDLSKEMLDKLERAVGTISENSNRVAVILERHENRLDESERADKLIIGMLEEMKVRHEKDFLLVTSRMDRIQKKTESNARFVIATTAVLTTLVTALQVFPPVFKLLTDSKSSAMIDGVEFNA